MISFILKFLPLLDLTLGILLSFFTLLFLLRLIMTWYPNVNIQKGLWLFITIPTNNILKVTKRIIPPIGGVDITPVIWIGLISFIREILVGQQGLIKLAIQSNLNLIN